MIRALVLCVAGALAGMAWSQEGPTTSPGAPSAGMTEAEALRLQIASFWHSGATEGPLPRVVLRVSFRPDGKVADVVLTESDGDTPASTEAAFQSARRAVLRADAAGLALPAGVAEAGLELVFDPDLGAIR